MGHQWLGTAPHVLYALACSVSVHGIRQITGTLARTGNAFPDSIYGYGWEWDDLGEYYGAGVDELIFNEGMAPTTLRPLPDTVRDSLYSGPAKNPAKTYLDAFPDGPVRKEVRLECGGGDSGRDVVRARRRGRAGAERRWDGRRWLGLRGREHGQRLAGGLRGRPVALRRAAGAGPVRVAPALASYRHRRGAGRAAGHRPAEP